MKQEMKRVRIFFLILFLALLALEFFIGIFVHDRLIRPYGGDLIVVIVLYALVRVFLPQKPRALSVLIFLFATIVEVTQIFPLVDLLGIKNHFLRVVMGTFFVWWDLLAYALGSIVNVLFDIRLWERNGKWTK